MLATVYTLGISTMQTLAVKTKDVCRARLRKDHPRKRLVGVAMNLESLGNRVAHQESEESKEGTVVAHVKVRNAQRTEHTGQCRNGACEVVWKPSPGQQSISNTTVQ